MTDFFPRMSMKANPDCDEYHCVKKQKVFREEEKQRLAREALEVKAEDVADEGPLHEDNEWGITLEEEYVPQDSTEQRQVAEGVQLAYEAASKSEDAADCEDVAAEESSISLDDLMKQMKSM